MTFPIPHFISFLAFATVGSFTSLLHWINLFSVLLSGFSPLGGRLPVRFHIPCLLLVCLLTSLFLHGYRIMLTEEAFNTIILPECFANLWRITSRGEGQKTRASVNCLRDPQRVHTIFQNSGVSWEWHLSAHTMEVLDEAGRAGYLKIISALFLTWPRLSKSHDFPIPCSPICKWSPKLLTGNSSLVKQY